MNILYLENHVIFARQVTQQFLAAHEVTVVPSIAEAKVFLSQSLPDLILSDYDLDDGKGDEFVRECRIAHPHLPIIAASAHEAGNSALLKAGATAVCSKMKFDRMQQTIDGLPK